MELKILIGGIIISGAWFMYREYRAEQKRKQRHQKDLNNVTTLLKKGVPMTLIKIKFMALGVKANE